MRQLNLPSYLFLCIISVLSSCAQVGSQAVVKEDYNSPRIHPQRNVEDADFVATSPIAERKSPHILEKISFSDSETIRETERPFFELISAESTEFAWDEVDQASYLHESTADRIPPAPFSNAGHAVGLSKSHGSTISLSDLEQMALENNPTLAQLSAVVSKAQGIRKQVGLYPNPVIGYSGDEMGNDGASGQQGGFISQTIVTGDKLRLNRAVASQDIQALSWDYEAQLYRVQNDVRLRFYEALGAQRRVKLALELKKVAEEGLKAAVQLLEARQTARPDVLQAQVQLNEVLIILQNAQFDYEAAWKQLASVIGNPDLAPARLEGTLEEKGDEAFTWEGTYRRLLDSSPELQAAYFRAQRARFMIQRQEAQPTPNLLTQFAVAKDNSTGDTITSVQVGIPLPLFNRNQGNIDIARSEYHRAVRDSERLELSLRNRLAVVFRNYQKSRQQVERYSSNILPIAEENLKLTDDGYRQGEFDFLRVLTARRTYFETNLAFVQSLTGLRLAEVQISGLLLTGGLDDVSDISEGSGGVDQRDQALSGQ